MTRETAAPAVLFAVIWGAVPVGSVMAHTESVLQKLPADLVWPVRVTAAALTIQDLTCWGVLARVSDLHQRWWFTSSMAQARAAVITSRIS